MVFRPPAASVPAAPRLGGAATRPLADDRPYPDDSEELAERLWWAAAYPALAPLARRRLMKAARPPRQFRNVRHSAVAERGPPAVMREK
jgi:hypothetical protein